jgi:hypothetical protein
MYNFKVYDKNWTLKFTISPKKVKSDISFSANINWWQWQLMLKLRENFSYNSIINSDIIKIYKGLALIYAWLVQNIVRNITNSFEEVEYPILWLWTLLNYLLYKDLGNYSFTKNQDPSQTVKDIVDYIDTIYPGILSYDLSSIDTYWSSISIDFANITCFEAIRKVATATWYRFFIDKDWKVYFKQKSTTVNHNFTVWKDIEQIQVEENSESLANKLRVNYKAWYSPYEDATSQTNYWLHEVFQSQTSLDLAWSDSFWNSYIATNKNPIKKTKIVLNKNYDLESIKIWDVIKVNNFSYSISWLQVVSYNYNWDKLEIWLENQSFFWNEIKNLIS